MTVDPSARPPVEFAIAPAVEAAASLHVLAAPGHHPRQAPWVRRCRGLDDGLKRTIRALASPLRSGLSDAVVARPNHHKAIFRPYWEGVFESEWERIAPLLEEEVAAVTNAYERGRLPAALEAAAASAKGPVIAVPSLFVHPHTWMHRGPDGATTIVYPIDPAPATAPAGDERLTVLLRAVASEIRLTLLRLIAVQPRSTKELADLAYLSEPAVSRHLNQMAGIGLLKQRREGYYVVYELNRTRIDDISSSLHRLFPR